MVCEGTLCAIHSFSSPTTYPILELINNIPSSCPAYYWTPSTNVDTLSKANCSNFRVQEIPLKSVSWQFPETPISFQWSSLKQVQLTSPTMAFRIFQVDSPLKHPFPDSAPSSPQPFPMWCSFQPLSPVRFQPLDYVAVCLYLLFKGIPRTDEILQMKSSQNPGDQNYFSLNLDAMLQEMHFNILVVLLSVASISHK